MGWITRTPWIRLTGTDWLVRLNRPRVTRTPRADWARVKLNIWKTRRLIIEASPMASGISPARAKAITSNPAVTISATTRSAAENRNSLDSRKPTIRRCGGTVTRAWSAADRSVSTLAGPACGSPIRTRSPCARLSR